MLRTRFEAAREATAFQGRDAGDMELAEPIKRFQFREARPKAASEIEDLKQASQLLGHTKERSPGRCTVGSVNGPKPTR